MIAVQCKRAFDTLPIHRPRTAQSLPSVPPPATMVPLIIPPNGQADFSVHSTALRELVDRIQKTEHKRDTKLGRPDSDTQRPSHGSETYQVGIDSLPQQVQSLKHRKGAKFNLLLVGQQGCGKTTFINTLFGTKVMPSIWDTLDDIKPHTSFEKTESISTHRVKLVERGFNLDLTLIETPGFGDYIDNMFAYIPITEYIDEHLRRYMFQDEQPDRSGKVDNRVHACLFFINPSSRGLSPSEIECMKHISSRVNLIPVISKADTLTTQEIEETKDLIRRIIKRQGIKICEFIEDEEVRLSIFKQCPFSLIGSESFFTIEREDGTSDTIRGRRYQWGVAEVMNPLHCDFVKLRDVLMGENMVDLISTTESYYEKCRGRLLETRVKGVSKLSKRVEEEKKQQESVEDQTKSSEDAEKEIVIPEFSHAQQKLLAELQSMNLNYEEVQYLSGITVAKALCVFDKSHLDKLVSDWHPVYLHTQLLMKRMIKDEAKLEELKQKNWKLSLTYKQHKYNEELGELREIIQGLKAEVRALEGDKFKSKSKSKKTKENDPTTATPHDDSIDDESIQADAAAAADASSPHLMQGPPSSIMRPPTSCENEAESMVGGLNSGHGHGSVSMA